MQSVEGLEKKISLTPTFSIEGLSSFISTDQIPLVKDHLIKGMFSPLEEFLARPSKKIRSELIKLGIFLAQEMSLSLCKDQQINQADQQEFLIKELCEAVEILHAGSLIIDDVQDGDLKRRGGPGLHVLYGEPLAINMGNFLYFWPLHRLQQLPLEDQKKLQFYEVYHQILVKAHFGQTLDLTMSIKDIPLHHLYESLETVSELKTGCLFELSLKWGGIVVGADKKTLNSLTLLGHELGKVLQMYNDVFQFFSSTTEQIAQEISSLKLTWLWYFIAQIVSSKDYHQLIALLPKKLIDPMAAEEVNKIFKQYSMHEELKKLLQQEKEKVLANFFQQQNFSSTFTQEIKNILFNLLQRIESAYVHQHQSTIPSTNNNSIFHHPATK